MLGSAAGSQDAKGARSVNAIDDLRQVLTERGRFGDHMHSERLRHPTDDEVIAAAVEIICNMYGMAPPWMRRGRPRL